MRCLPLSISCAVAFATLSSGAVMAQGAAAPYPSKPVRLVVPFAPSGPTDIEARLYTAKASTLLGQPFVIDYKPGAATTIGTAQVAKAPPDGYTLLTVTGSFVSFPPLYPDFPYDIVKDFAPISMMSLRHTLLMVRPSFPAKTFAEYIAYAKANPGKVNVGTAGAGGVIHLAHAWIHNATNTKVTFIHYKGAPGQMVDLQADRLDTVMSALVSGMQLMKAGKVRALAVTNNTRSRLLPDVPTIAEQGVPGYNYSSWQGFVAPGATPPAIVNKLSETFAQVAKSPDVAAKLGANGTVMVGSTPAQFRQTIITESALWRKVVRDAGIKP